jgi:hypothetical protein
LRSEHDWTINVQATSTHIFVGTHTAPSAIHDDDNIIIVIIIFVFGIPCLVTLQSGARSPDEKKEQVWKRAHGKGKQKSGKAHPEDTDSGAGGE